MTRITKFKAWSKKLNKFVFPDVINHNINLGINSNLMHFDQSTGQFRKEECELVQFTGLKDKNGKEIYEGDIVQCKHYYIGIKWWSTVSEISEIQKCTEEGRNSYHIETNTIKFRDGAFCWSYKPLEWFIIRDNMITEKTETGQTHRNDYEQKWWDFEVIGNIYENPELVNN